MTNRNLDFLGDRNTVCCWNLQRYFHSLELLIGHITSRQIWLVTWEQCWLLIGWHTSLGTEWHLCLDTLWHSCNNTALWLVSFNKTAFWLVCFKASYWPLTWVGTMSGTMRHLCDWTGSHLCWGDLSQTFSVTSWQASSSWQRMSLTEKHCWCLVTSSLVWQIWSGISSQMTSGTVRHCSSETGEHSVDSDGAQT